MKLFKVATLLTLLSTQCYAGVEDGMYNPPTVTEIKTQHVDSLSCLAMNLYFEARSESDISLITITAVVFNRVDDVRFPDTICEVVYSDRAFSWLNGDVSLEVKNIEQYKRVYKIAEHAIMNRQFIQEMSEGVDHYHEKSIKPYWSKSKKVTFKSRVDNHLFYSSKW